MAIFLIFYFGFGVVPMQKEKLVPFEQGERWGYKDVAGKVVIPPKYLTAGEFSAHGIAAAADQSGWVIIDSSGAVLIRPYVFDNGPDYFNQGLARFVTKGKYGFFDERGKIAIPARFDYVEPFHEGLAAFCERCVQEKQGEHIARQGGKWGYIDRRGRTVVRAIYVEVRPVENGRARVRSGSQWMTLDPAGRPR
jgi:hypothetical protein